MRKLTSAASVIQSYLARRPLTTRLLPARAGEAFPGGWVVNKAGCVITGKLGGEKVQLFAHPDRAIEDFANTTGPEEMLRFTKRYGVLHRDDEDWVVVAPGEKVVMGDSFLIHCDQWMQRQKSFRAEWERKGTPDDRLARTVADQITPGSSTAGRTVQAFVRPCKRGFQLELQPDDLLGALWLAFLGFSDRTGKCQNPTCETPYFLASRRDQKFCNEKCSRLVANRRWWDENGAKWRRDHGAKAAKKSQGEK
jgi:hypothetical protein